MSDSQKFELYGFLAYVPLDMGFITPVFAAGEELFIQVSNDNICIEEFVTVPAEQKLITPNPLPFRIERRKGDACIFGFKFNEIEIYYDECFDLSDYLKIRLLSTLVDPLVRDMVESFSTLMAGRGNPVEKIRETDLILDLRGMLGISFEEITSKKEIQKEQLMQRQRYFMKEIGRFKEDMHELEMKERIGAAIGTPVGAFIPFIFAFGAAATAIFSSSKSKSYIHFDAISSKIELIEYRWSSLILFQENYDSLINLMEERNHLIGEVWAYFKEHTQDMSREHKLTTFEKIKQMRYSQETVLISINKFVDNHWTEYWQQHYFMDDEVRERLSGNLDKLELSLYHSSANLIKLRSQKLIILDCLANGSTNYMNSVYELWLLRLEDKILSAEGNADELRKWISEISKSMKRLR
ncbi:hypothetical protein [Mucilaginibacter sp. SP1R1]|uniref:hypothetical protein n=1 Tax=Mucilaginibacter sp. SP1R1 TaxID=2723091 RepID=UPI001620CABE|nr:hypothetical protein [Mucilaginibacter sp. SP1R1]MBB6151342.1 hypothetical protein [Mucilaginibacter sp. SP1R1]